MDMCAYWTVKGHSSGDMLIRPHIHEYLGDGNEGILHCCMRMSGLPGGSLRGVCGQVWQECGKSVCQVCVRIFFGEGGASIQSI